VSPIFKRELRNKWMCMKAHGKDFGVRSWEETIYEEILSGTRHPSVSLLCKWIFGRMRETKITNTELNWLYSTLPGSQSTPLTYDQLVVLLSNIKFGRYWFGVLPLHIGYLFKIGYYKKPESSPTRDFPRLNISSKTNI
jgi:hypothetical protein